MSENYFATRDQYIFVTYHDVIKLTYPVMLLELIKNYYDDLKDYIDLDKIKKYDIYNLERICVERTYKNPLVFLRKEKCSIDTCNSLLHAFEDEMIEMYTKSRLSQFGGRMTKMMDLSSVKKVYIYTERPSIQAKYDCDVYFNSYMSKIKFVHGDVVKIINEMSNKPTTYIVNDIDILKKLLDEGLLSYTENCIAEIGCNFQLSKFKEKQIELKYDMENLMEEKIYKLGILPIVSLERKHFSAILGDNTINNQGQNKPI